ncbi:MAG: metal-dependent hydrolase [Pseudomonadota bacterium]
MMTAISTVSTTPEGVTIEARNRKFDLDNALAVDWFADDPFLTAFFNALSISFPTGEREFIDSIRHYEKSISDEKLLSEIRGFYRQEGIHSREHRQYNRQLCSARGYDLAALEGVYVAMLAKVKANPKVTPEIRLASTLALEHFTAGLAEILLDSDFLENAHPAVRELWLWHSLEEMEHKSVAHDVYVQIGGGYVMRKRIMRLAMLILFRNVLTVSLKLLHHDKQLWRWKTLKSAVWLFFGRTGLIRRYLSHHREFFREDFHPWNADTRDLLEYWKPRLSA